MPVYGLPILTLLLVIFFAILLPDTFLTTLNARSILSEFRQTVEQIAETIHISAKTVANTRYLLRSKLGVASDIELVRLALQQGVISIAELGADLGTQG